MQGVIEPGRVYTLKEALELLVLSESTFRLLQRRGEVKGQKLGRQWRFLGSELLKLVEDKATPSTEEPS